MKIDFVREEERKRGTWMLKHIEDHWEVTETQRCPLLMLMLSSPGPERESINNAYVSVFTISRFCQIYLCVLPFHCIFVTHNPSSFYISGNKQQIGKLYYT